MGLTAEKKDITAAVEKRQAEFWRMSDEIWNHAELGFQEYKSAALLMDALETAGFEIKRGVAGMPTAFTATWRNGNGEPVIGLLTEYDALPGLSQVGGSPQQKPLIPGAPGHGCGHNTMGTMQTLAAIAIQDFIRRQNLDVTLIVYGGPAEEILASRPFMVRDGLFEGVDTVIDCHASGCFEAVGGTLGSALYSFRVTYFGKTSHAGNDPWMGRSAADAVELLHAGTERMREHLRPTNRIHWITTYGGEAPNIVPERAATWYLLRDTDENLEQVLEWVRASVEGAALMTQTTYDFETLGACHQRHYNPALAEALLKNIEAIGLPKFTPEEASYARSLQKTVGIEEAGLDYDVRLFDAEAGPFRGASSDVGDVCLVVPTGCIRFPIFVPGSPGHNWSVVSASATTIAHKGISAGAKAVAMTVYDLITDPALLERVKSDFSELSTRRPYRSFLPDDARPPLDFYKDAQAKYRNAIEAGSGKRD